MECDNMILKVKKLNDNAILPKRASKNAAGYDIFASESAVITGFKSGMVSTGIAIAIPAGHYGRIAPRSSLAKRGIGVGAGVIDEDYRGAVSVILFNHSKIDYPVCKGERIAQLIIEKISTPDVCEVDDLDETERGDGGFGSTGK